LEYYKNRSMELICVDGWPMLEKRFI